MKQKPTFKNLPKLQAKKFARLRREKTRQRIKTLILRWLGKRGLSAE
ncbi:hypothetical protein [Nitrospira sp. Kam-Ns4a]